MVVSSGSALINTFKINLVLTELVKKQVFESLVMLGCGMVTMLLYMIFTRKIKIYIKNSVISALSETAFWVFMGTLACRFLYYASFGALSVHVVCAFLCGVFLWNLLFYATMSVGDAKCLNKRKKEAESLKTPIK